MRQTVISVLLGILVGIVGGEAVIAGEPVQSGAGAPPRIAPQAKDTGKYELYKSSQYLLLGRLREHQYLGEPEGSKPGSAPLYFHKFSFTPVKTFRGDLVESTKRLHKQLGMAFRADWTFGGRLLTATKEMSFPLRENETMCIVVLEHMKAGSHEAHIPVRILRVDAVTNEALSAAKAAAKD